MQESSGGYLRALQLALGKTRLQAYEVAIKSVQAALNKACQNIWRIRSSPLSETSGWALAPGAE